MRDEEQDPQDEEEEQEDPIDGEVEDPARVLEPPEPPPPPPERPSVRRQPPKRPRTPAQAAAGLGASSGRNAPFRATDLMQLWGEVLDRLRQYPDLGSVYDLDVRVCTPEGKPLSTFPASAALGNETQSPGDALVGYVIENVHLPLSMGPATYDVQMFWRRNSRIYARCRINLPSRQEIMNMRIAGERRAQGQAPPPYPYAPQGYGAPPPSQGYGPAPAPYAPAPPSPYYGAAQGYAPPPPGYGVPHGYGAPAPAAQVTSDRELALISELAASRGQHAALFQDVLRRIQETPAGITPEEMRLRLENADLRARLSMAPAAAPAAQPAQPAPAAAAAPAESAVGTGATAQIVDRVRSNLESVIASAMQTAVSRVAKDIQKSVMTGFGATPAEAEAATVVAEVVEAEPPDDHKEYHAVPLAAKWADGRPVMYTPKKDGSGVDLQGAAMENPVVLETMMNIGNKIGEAVAVGIQKLSGIKFQQPESEVVRSIPRGALDGTPQTQSPQAPPPPPPPPNGAARPGWPQV